MSFRRWLRDLSGRGARDVVEALLAQLDVVHEAVQRLEQALRGSGGEDLTALMEDYEHRADERRRHLVEELTRTLTTPLDREDLFRVSRSVDDVVDDLRDFARERDLYRPHNVDPCLPLLEILAEGLQTLRSAVDALGRDQERVLELAHQTKRAGNRMRVAYERAVAELFDGELTMDVLKQRELLRRLDIVALRLAAGADGLSDGQVKRR